MTRLGAVLAVFGFGSALLHFTDIQFQLLSWAEKWQPAIGLIIGGVGAVLLLIATLRSKDEEAGPPQGAYGPPPAAPHAPFGQAPGPGYGPPTPGYYGGPPPQGPGQPPIPQQGPQYGPRPPQGPPQQRGPGPQSGPLFGPQDR